MLESYGLTLSDVADIVGKESFVETSGELRTADRVTKIKVAQQGYYYKDFADIILISKADGRQIKLGDIATIQDTFVENPAVLSRFQGKPSIGLSLVSTESSDVTEIVKQAREVVQEWKDKNLLPNGVELTEWYDQSTFIKERLSLLMKNGITGILLIFLLLALTLNIKVAFFVALGIPVCVTGTLMLMGQSILNISISEMSTFGFILALGILVDDAVVIGESIYATRKSDGDSIENTIKAVHKVSVPTVFGVLTTMAAFYPLSMIEGFLGKIFAGFAVIVVACLFFSLIESKLILPAHLAHVDTSEHKPKNIFGKAWKLLRDTIEQGIEWLKNRFYKKALKNILKHRYASLITFFALFVMIVGLVTTGKVETRFFPDIQMKVVSANFVIYEESGYNLAFKNASVIEKKAYEVNEHFTQKYNLKKPLFKNIRTLVEDATSGNVQVQLEVGKETPVSIMEFTNAWRNAVGQLEGARSLNFTSGFEGDDDIRLELFSNDPDQLLAVGQKLKEKISQIPGVMDMNDNMTPGAPQINLELNDKGRALGLTTKDLATLVQNGFYGYVVQTNQRDELEVKVRVRFPSNERQSLDNLLNTRIRLTSGSMVPLSSIARFKSGFTVSTITRQGYMRSIYITGKVDKAAYSPAGIVAKIDKTILPGVLQSYPDTTYRFGGEVEEQETTTNSMTRLFILSLLVIYILLAIPLGSYSQPVVVMCAIPFGFLGAILGHWFIGIPLNLLSFLGILALGGVMVNDSLLLISSFNQYKNMGISTLEAILTAAPGRLRAILLTSLTTYIGLVPLLKETSEQAQFLIPAATSLAYGVLFGTFITLFFIPILVCIREDIKELFSSEVKRENIDAIKEIA